MKTIQCQIVSPQKTNVYKNLISIKLPAYQGEMEILRQHAETFVLLKTGQVILVKKNHKKINVEITRSECHIKDNNVTIIL